ncbi:MAG TPA: type ISP restriction/modification enzyme [Hanamia sp.]|nr:type ISP restriction/modification enzyme [Hanamia sp.]
MQTNIHNHTIEPNYHSSKKNFDEHIDYEKGFKIDDLFPVHSSGIKTDDDNLASFDKFSHFNNKYQYRVFDDRFINYDLRKIIAQNPVIQNLIPGKNISLITTRKENTFDFRHIFLSKLLVDINSISPQEEEISYCFPLYLYPDIKNQLSIQKIQIRTPNLNPDIVNQIASQLSLTFTNEKEIPTEGEVCFINSVEVRPEFRLTFAPIDILDYIYAFLHSPSYRKKYKEFLKIDFSRLPYPKDSTTFWKLVALGGELRQIHLLECTEVERYITQYQVDGNNLVEEIKYVDNTVFINETQYFNHVPQIAWEFYIGGYQPAQKWLKDRKGRELNFEDILHYQKIIVALMETDRIMIEIEKVKI